jgi:hypothetical protein
VLNRYPVHYSMVTSIIDRRSGVAQGLSINRAIDQPQGAAKANYSVLASTTDGTIVK